MATVGAGPTLQVSISHGVGSLYNPNVPLTQLSDGERKNGGVDETEKGYIPVELAEIRIRAMLDDLDKMKTSHHQYIEKMQKTYNNLVRDNHKIAQEQLQRARALAQERIGLYRNRVQELVAELKELQNKAKKGDDTIKELAKKIESQKQAEDRYKAEVEAKKAEIATLRDDIDRIKAMGGDAGAAAAHMEQAKKYEEEIAQLKVEIENNQTTIAALEEDLMQGGAPGVSRVVRATGGGGSAVDEVLKKLTAANDRVNELEAERAQVTAQVEQLKKVAKEKAQDAADAQDLREKVNELQEQLIKKERERDRELEKLSGEMVVLNSKMNDDKVAALAAQQAMYDKMIKQMIRAGEEEERKKQEAEASSASAAEIDALKLKVDETQDRIKGHEEEKVKIGSKIPALNERKKELEELIRIKTEDKEHKEVEKGQLENEVNGLIKMAEDEKRDKEQAAAWTKDDVQAQFDKLKMDFEGFTLPKGSALLEACASHAR